MLWEAVGGGQVLESQETQTSSEALLRPALTAVAFGNEPTDGRSLSICFSNKIQFKKFLFFFFYWKGRYAERRDREEDLPSDDSLPK